MASTVREQLAPQVPTELPPGPGGLGLMSVTPSISPDRSASAAPVSGRRRHGNDLLRQVLAGRRVRGDTQPEDGSQSRCRLDKPEHEQPMKDRVALRLRG